MSKSNKTPAVVVTNQKGGVGKSTIVFNLAGVCAKAGKKVLCVDLDPQGNLSQSFAWTGETTVTDMFDGKPSGPVETNCKGVHLIPADRNLSGVLPRLIADFDLQFKLKDFLQTLSGFDLVLIDTPPTMGSFSLAGALAADFFLIPLSTQFFSIQATAEVMNSMTKVKDRLNPSLSLLGAIVSIHDKRTALGDEVLKRAKAFFKDFLFDQVISRTVKVEESQVKKNPVVEMFPGSESAREYETLGREVMTRLGMLR